jgi:hypothetical protein
MPIASLLHLGMTMPAALPWAGQMAPKMQADAVRWSLGAEGRLPRLAQRRVIPVFCPTRASSCHHILIGVPGGSRAVIAASWPAKSF